MPTDDPRQGRVRGAAGRGKKAGLVLEIVPHRIDVDVDVRVHMNVLFWFILEQIRPPAIQEVHKVVQRRHIARRIEGDAPPHEGPDAVWIAVVRHDWC